MFVCQFLAPNSLKVIKPQEDQFEDRTSNENSQIIQSQLKSSTKIWDTGLFISFNLYTGNINYYKIAGD